MDWLALLTAFGVGSIVSVGVQSWLDSRKEYQRKRFSERREAYAGLLDAYRQAAIENTPDSRTNFGYWELRCRLVASERVARAIRAFATTEPAGSDRNTTQDELINAMRNDLEL
jgi:hypothetical protein